MYHAMQEDLARAHYLERLQDLELMHRRRLSREGLGRADSGSRRLRRSPRP
jgi:hypothetical protein